MLMKLLSEYLLLPSGIIALLTAMVPLALLIPRFRRWALLPALAVMTMYLVFGSGLTSHWLMSKLEYKYPPAQDNVVNSAPDTMVVLTGYAKTNPQAPLSGHVNGSSGFRILEAARIFHKAQRMLVIISGDDDVPVIMRDLLAGLGVPERQVDVDTVSYSTYESAVHLQERLKGKRFYLVTSAGHMPRAMGVFLKQGLDPVPAPTNYLSSPSLHEVNPFPNGQHLAVSDLAVHEYLGLIWYRLLGRL